MVKVILPVKPSSLEFQRVVKERFLTIVSTRPLCFIRDIVASEIIVKSECLII